MAEEDKDLLIKDPGAGPGCLKQTLLGMLLVLVVVVVAGAFTCLRYVKPWEVGLRYHRFSFMGVFERGSADLLKPGYNVVVPYFNEFNKYDCSIQRFELAPEFAGAPKPDRQPLEIRTARDQDEIQVYVTILYQLDRTQAAKTRALYPNDESIRENAIGKHCPAILNDFLGEIMTANQFYNMTIEQREKIQEMRKTDPGYMIDKYPSEAYLFDRTTQAEKALNEMNVEFKVRQGVGIEVVKVLIWDFKFKDEIEASIISKVIADEKVEMEKALKDAASARAEWQRLAAEANAGAEAELARGTAESRKIMAEAEKYKTEKYAEGDKMILLAESEGKAKINQALAGSGGRAYVGIEYAKALTGLDLIVLPAGGEEGINPLNLDDTIDKFAPAARRGIGQ